MFSNRIFAIAIVALFGFANAGDVIKKGTCPTYVEVIPDFNIEKYMGFWHEYSKYPNIFEPNGRCNAATYSLESDGRVRVNNSMINIETGQLEDIIGYATPVENGKLKVVFPNTPTDSAASNYWVLDTDYTVYSLVYACRQMGDYYATYVWLLTRERNPHMIFHEKPLETMKRFHLSLELLKITDLSDCSDTP